MSDFDFDEIDRAVNGVISDDTPAKPAADTVTPSVAPQTPLAAEKPEVSSPITRSAPAVRRSSGRFMDMVHSSSDMRTRSAPAVVPSAPSIAPVSSAAPGPEPAPLSAPADTLDFNNDLAAIGDDWQKTTESPFLPDAKVEKRPLGGEPIASSMKLEDLLDEPDNDLLGTGSQEPLLEAPDDLQIEAHTMPDPIDFAASLDEPAVEQPAEGSQLEANENEVPSGDAATPPDIAVDLDASLEASAPDEALVDTAQDGPVEVEEPVVEAASDAPSQQTVPPEEPVGPTSISQQYKEQPSSKQESGAIYDTEAYHQPLAKAPKKRSGALAIVWILLLVLLGAGAGAAFYVYVLPML